MANDQFEPTPVPAVAPVQKPVEIPAVAASEKQGDIVVLTNREAEDEQLACMIDRFCAVMPHAMARS
jgi:hypothetical protein